MECVWVTVEGWNKWREGRGGGTVGVGRSVTPVGWCCPEGVGCGRGLGDGGEVRGGCGRGRGRRQRR